MPTVTLMIENFCFSSVTGTIALRVMFLNGIWTQEISETR